ncbi:MAG: hypothetical protein ACREI9_07735 [Nitrospiraceae bacterium]
MKKFWMLALVFALCSLSACSCAIEKKAVDDLDATQQIIYPEYLKLVEKEYASDPAKIDNRRKLVRSSNDIMIQLKKSVEK